MNFPHDRPDGQPREAVGPLRKIDFAVLQALIAMQRISRRSVAGAHVNGANPREPFAAAMQRRIELFSGALGHGRATTAPRGSFSPAVFQAFRQENNDWDEGKQGIYLNNSSNLKRLRLTEFTSHNGIMQGLASSVGRGKK